MKINSADGLVTAEFHDGRSTLYIDTTEDREQILVTAERDGGRSHVQLYLTRADLKAALLAIEGLDG